MHIRNSFFSVDKKALYGFIQPCLYVYKLTDQQGKVCVPTKKDSRRFPEPQTRVCVDLMLLYSYTYAIQNVVRIRGLHGCIFSSLPRPTAIASHSLSTQADQGGTNPAMSPPQKKTWKRGNMSPSRKNDLTFGRPKQFFFFRTIYWHFSYQ